MRQTLLRIPLSEPWSLGPLGEWPGFGFGIVLALWVVLGAIWFYRRRTQLGWNAGSAFAGTVWLVVAAVIVQVPAWAEREFDAVIAQQTRFLDANETAEAHLRRGLAWQAKGELVEAATDFEAARKLDPDSGQALRLLAWMLATSPEDKFRDERRSLKFAREAMAKGDVDDALLLDTLAAAQAEAGDFEAAVASAGQAARAAEDSRDPQVREMLPEIRKRIALYENQQPYRNYDYGKSMPIYGYGFMLFLGFLAGGWTAVRRAERVGIRGEVIWDLAMWSFFAGIIGGRVFYCIQYADQVFYNFVDGKLVLKSFGELVFSAVNLPDGGLVLYGGVIAGVGTYFVFCYRNNLSALKMADIAMPSLLLGLAFGRMGCFFNGCCYGDRCDLPWAVTFPLGSVPDIALVRRGFVAADNTLVFALHPSQLYSSLNALILSVLTAAYFRYRHRDGAVLALGMLAYPVTRFVIEYLRGDEMGQFNTNFTISQWISIGLFSAGLVYLAWLTRQPERPASLPLKKDATSAAA